MADAISSTNKQTAQDGKTTAITVSQMIFLDYERQQ